MRLITDYGVTLYKIGDNVFQRGKLHKLSMQQKIKLFADYNITMVVGLALDKDPDLVKLDKKYYIEYIFRPIPDGALCDTTRSSLLQLANKISDNILRESTSVLCYCNAGRNRSGLMNALILRNLCMCSGKEALEIVRQERPRAVANEHFETFLRSLP